MNETTIYNGWFANRLGRLTEPTVFLTPDGVRIGTFTPSEAPAGVPVVPEPDAGAPSEAVAEPVTE